MSFIVAIDGPAGTGKGTITKLVAEKLNLINIDTGAMYRCVALELLNNNVNIDDIESIKKLLENINIDMKNENNMLKIFLNNNDVTDEIRTKRVNDIVSQVSHIPVVRENMVDLQRKMGINKNVVMEGRDIGTNVFPNANVKIYLDALAEERAKRRYRQEIEKGRNPDYEEILKNIIFRDENDKNATIAPLKMAEDAIYIDTTKLTIAEVEEKVIQIIRGGEKIDV